MWVLSIFDKAKQEEARRKDKKEEEGKKKGWEESKERKLYKKKKSEVVAYLGFCIRSLLFVSGIAGRRNPVEGKKGKKMQRVLPYTTLQKKK